MTDLERNLGAFFRADGKTVILPVDHGTAIPVPALERPRELIAAVGPYCDGFVVNYGLARAADSELSRKGICLRTDIYKPALPGNRDCGSWQVFGAREARRLGAHAVMSMLYTNHPEEDRLFTAAAHLIAECHELGLPVIIEALPLGIGRTAAYTPENIGFAARAAAELGADIVKTAWPGDRDAFSRIVAASFVPVIVLGGARESDEAVLLQMVRDAMDCGAAGIAIGRHVWQHPRPVTMARALDSIVHGGAGLPEALASLRA